MMKMIALLVFLLQFVPPLLSAESNNDIVLYYSPRCPHSQKVLSYLSQEGLKIPMKNVLQDRQAKKELQESGEFMIVPCLVVNGKAIYDASDIIQWLSTHEKDGLLSK